MADRSIKLVAPIVFLFDGGEETFSQVCSRICLLMHHPLVHPQMPISTVVRACAHVGCFGTCQSFQQGLTEPVSVPSGRRRMGSCRSTTGRWEPL